MPHWRGRLNPQDVELIIDLLDEPHVVVAVVPLKDRLVQRQVLSHFVVRNWLLVVLQERLHDGAQFEDFLDVFEAVRAVCDHSNLLLDVIWVVHNQCFKLGKELICHN